MIDGYGPVSGALMGTIFTWGMTAVGAACVYLMPSDIKASQTILDTMLGFAAGVMIAASFWSLLAPGM
jgi:zinc transporter ZupT